jgi:hypothetical protein
MPRPNPRDPEANLSAALGEELRDLRIDAGFATQGAWAKATGYPRESISRRETGDTAFTDLLDSCNATSRERKTLTRMLRLAARPAGPSWSRNRGRSSWRRSRGGRPDSNEPRLAQVQLQQQRRRCPDQVHGV